jgi:pyridoxal phosphate enzyme (YggS family)
VSGVGERLQRIRAAISRAAIEAGRNDSVTLVAVSKTVNATGVLEAYAAGHRVFGENRVQEARRKVTELEDTVPEAEWHLIGHLQTNKINGAVPLFSFIESVDSVRLATGLDRAAGALGKRLPVLLEVNVAEEESKGGFTQESFRAALPDLARLENLALRGIMTVAPMTAEPADIAWVFRALRELRDDVRDRFDLLQFHELSMGMSHDYEVAIREGATIVRIGTAIFGRRPV